jgi:hypothetical protein
MCYPAKSLGATRKVTAVELEILGNEAKLNPLGHNERCSSRAGHADARELDSSRCAEAKLVEGLAADL